MVSARDEQAGALVNALVGLMRAGRALASKTGTERRATSTPTAVLKAVNAGHTRPSDIAADLQIDLSVVSRAITVLETEALVARTPDPHDARAQILSITDAGRERIEHLRQVFVQLAAEMLSEWTPAEIEEAAHTLNRLSETLRGEFARDLPDRLISASTLVGPSHDAATTGHGPQTSPDLHTDEPTADTGDEPQRRHSLTGA